MQYLTTCLHLFETISFDLNAISFVDQLSLYPDTRNISWSTICIRWQNKHMQRQKQADDIPWTISHYYQI